VRNKVITGELVPVWVLSGGEIVTPSPDEQRSVLPPIVKYRVRLPSCGNIPVRPRFNAANVLRVIPVTPPPAVAERQHQKPKKRGQSILVLRVFMQRHPKLFAALNYAAMAQRFREHCQKLATYPHCPSKPDDW